MTKSIEGKRRFENLAMLSRFLKKSIVQPMLAGVALLAIACEPKYAEVSEDDLVAMELQAVVESVTVDFKNLRERGINIYNGGKRLRFQNYADWFSTTPEPGCTIFPPASGYLCSQYHPVVGDSISKSRNSRKMYVRIRKTKKLDSILVVSRWKVEKVREMNIRIIN